MKVLTLELATEIIVFASPEVPISRIGVDFIYTNKKNYQNNWTRFIREKQK